MYYSDIRFVVATKDQVTCELITFNPYRYLKSNAPDFIPDPPAGEEPPEPIDCSALSKEECWGGAAPFIIENFPADNGVYYLPDDGLSRVYNLPSGNSQRAESADRSGHTNANVTNNLPVQVEIQPLRVL